MRWTHIVDQAGCHHFKPIVMKSLAIGLDGSLINETITVVHQKILLCMHRWSIKVWGKRYWTWPLNWLIRAHAVVMFQLSIYLHWGPQTWLHQRLGFYGWLRRLNRWPGSTQLRKRVAMSHRFGHARTHFGTLLCGGEVSQGQWRQVFQESL